MSDTTAGQLPSRTGPVWALARRWPIAVVLAVVGLVVGVLLANRTVAIYTAEARVAVGYGDLSSGAIAGFPTAAQDLASNYARYVNDQGLLGSSASGIAIGDDVSVTATPIPSSNVIRVITQSSSSSHAESDATAVAKQLIQAVNNPQDEDSPEQLLQKYNEAALTAAQAGADQSDAERRYNAAVAQDLAASRLEALRSTVVSTTATSAEADLKQSALQSQYLAAVQASRSADLVLVSRGTVTSNDKTSRQQRYALVGLVVGLALSLVIASLLERRRRPVRQVADDAPRHSADEG